MVDDRIAEVIEKLDRIEAGRQALVNALWAQIPAEIAEYAYVATGTSVTTTPQVTELVRVTAVIASVPAGTTGTLTLGHLVLPVPAGLSVVGHLRLLVDASATRTLTVKTKGAIALVVCGEVAPTRGVV